MSNVINGTVPTEANIKGSLNTVYGKDGKSAYGVAVENGFEGTEAEWLESLKGDSGVYIGSGDMPENCNVQIDPDGDDFGINQAVEMAQSALEKSAEANDKYAACVEATERANAVKEEIVAGGYIESLKETHRGGKFSFWVGTQAEYDALSDKVDNCLYLITDDPTLTTIYTTIENQKIETNFAESGNYYEKWADGTFKAKAKYTFEGVIAAEYGNAYYSVIQDKELMDVFFPDITNYLTEIFDITATVGNTNELLGVNVTNYRLPTNGDSGNIKFYVFSHKEFTNAITATVTFDLLGRWK